MSQNSTTQPHMLEVLSLTMEGLIMVTAVSVSVYSWGQIKQQAACHNCSQGPPAEKTGRGSLLNHPSSPHPHPTPHDPIRQGTELSRTESSQLDLAECLTMTGLYQLVFDNSVLTLNGLSIPKRRTKNLYYTQKPTIFSLKLTLIYI